jgi:hypothetical protein
MNNDANDKAAFPETRQKKLNSKRALWLILLFGCAVILILGGLFGAIVGYYDAANGTNSSKVIGPWAIIFSGIAIGALTLWWSLKYWHTIDEMAQRAHLDSWFWGGVGASFPVLALGAFALAMPEFKVELIERFAASSTHAFGLGAIVMYSSMLLGYTIFWLIWWAKKR